MRKFLTLLLSMLALLIFSACSAPAGDSDAGGGDDAGASSAGSIAVLLPDSASSARWEADDRRFLAGAFDAAGVEYTIVNAEGDARAQQTQAEQAITNGAKVLLLVNLDSGSGAARRRFLCQL